MTALDVERAVEIANVRGVSFEEAMKLVRADLEYNQLLRRYTWRVVYKYATMFGVRIVRDQEEVNLLWAALRRAVDKDPLPVRRERRWRWHPMIRGIAFNKKRREVHIFREPPAKDLDAGNPKYLAHEVTHVIWPTRFYSDAGPNEEWDSGMISFELAWLKRLAGETPIGRCAFEEFNAYAYDGAPIDLEAVERVARKIVRRCKLPDPWA